MPSPPPIAPTPVERRFALAARAAAALVAAAGALVLAGWIFDSPTLRGGFSPRGITVKTNAGLCLLGAGVALALVVRAPASGWRPRAARALAAFVAALGALTLVQHAAGVDLGIDQALFREPPGEIATASPNRMGPPSSISFALIGIALWLASRRRAPAVVHGLAAVVAMIALLPTIGFVYGVEPLFGIARVTGISLPTALSLIALALGTIAAVPDGPVSALLAAPSAGGVLLRRVALPVLLLPIVLGQAYLVLRRGETLDRPFAVAALVVAVVLVLAVLLWWSARSLDRLDVAAARAREERRGIEERLSLAVFDANMGTWDADLESGDAVWSRSQFALLGFPPHALGRASHAMWLERVHPDDRQRVEAELARARAAREAYRSSFRVLRADTGEERWLDCFGRFVDGQGAASRRFVGLCSDATEARRSEDRLRASEALLRTATESARVGLAVLDREQRYTFVNPAYSRFTGVPVEETLGRRVRDVVGPSYELLRPYLERAFGGEHVSFEVTLNVPTSAARGEPAHLMVTYEPQLGPDGPRGIVVVVVDLTERRRALDAERALMEERERLLDSERAARRDAEHASHLKDEFLATVSHELRTPLNAILGWSQLLGRPGIEPADAAKGVETIARNARLQAQLIEDLLDMSRIVSGKIRLAVELVELDHVVTSALESVETAAQAKGVRIERTSAPGATVRGDPARLQQVLWNLLSNAVKFTPERGRVEVRVSRTDGHVEVSVSDTGRGIRTEFLPHIFERFRQGDASTTRRYGGLGLGLAIVRHMVELHGGSVRAESDGEGRGATFCVQLPLALEAGLPAPAGDGEAPAARASAPLEHADLSGARILVVDDEPDAREMIRRVLEECGASVETVGSAEEALARLARGGLDVLVADIGMPERDGFDLVREQRARERAGAAPLPALALTAFAREEDRRRSLDAGFDLHLAKPIEPTELTGALAQLVRRARA